MVGLVKSFFICLAVSFLLEGKMVVGKRQLQFAERGFLDITINGKPKGRIVIDFFSLWAPKTVKKFTELLQKNGTSGYKDSKFHLTYQLKQYSEMCGGVQTKTGQPIQNTYIEDEDTTIIMEPYSVRMLNDKKTKTSQFCICSGHLCIQPENGITLGKVVEGMNVVTEIGESSAKKNASVVIVNSGMLDITRNITFSNGTTYTVSNNTEWHV